MTLITRQLGTTSRAGNAVDKLNTALWTAQGALALVFLFAGTSKLVMSAEQMTSNSEVEFPVLFMRFIGVCEVAGALGLVLPGVSRVLTSLTALAACGLVVIMAGATVTTAMVGPAAFALFPLVVGLAAAFVAYGRTYLAPLGR